MPGGVDELAGDSERTDAAVMGGTNPLGFAVLQDRISNLLGDGEASSEPIEVPPPPPRSLGANKRKTSDSDENTEKIYGKDCEETSDEIQTLAKPEASSKGPASDLPEESLDKEGLSDMSHGTRTRLKSGGKAGRGAIAGVIGASRKKENESAKDHDEHSSKTATPAHQNPKSEIEHLLSETSQERTHLVSDTSQSHSSEEYFDTHGRHDSEDEMAAVPSSGKDSPRNDPPLIARRSQMSPLQRERPPKLLSPDEKDLSSESCESPPEMVISGRRTGSASGGKGKETATLRKAQQQDEKGDEGGEIHDVVPFESKSSNKSRKERRHKEKTGDREEAGRRVIPETGSSSRKAPASERVTSSEAVTSSGKASASGRVTPSGSATSLAALTQILHRKPSKPENIRRLGRREKHERFEDLEDTATPTASESRSLRAERGKVVIERSSEEVNRKKDYRHDAIKDQRPSRSNRVNKVKLEKTKNAQTEKQESGQKSNIKTKSMKKNRSVLAVASGSAAVSTENEALPRFASSKAHNEIRGTRRASEIQSSLPTLHELAEMDEKTALTICLRTIREHREYLAAGEEFGARRDSPRNSERSSSTKDAEKSLEVVEGKTTPPATASAVAAYKYAAVAVASGKRPHVHSRGRSRKKMISPAAARAGGAEGHEAEVTEATDAVGAQSGAAGAAASKVSEKETKEVFKQHSKRTRLEEDASKAATKEDDKTDDKPAADAESEKKPGKYTDRESTENRHEQATHDSPGTVQNERAEDIRPTKTPSPKKPFTSEEPKKELEKTVSKAREGSGSSGMPGSSGSDADTGASSRDDDGDRLQSADSGADAARTVESAKDHRAAEEAAAALAQVSLGRVVRSRSAPSLKRDKSGRRSKERATGSGVAAAAGGAAAAGATAAAGTSAAADGAASAGGEAITGVATKAGGAAKAAGAAVAGRAAKVGGAAKAGGSAVAGSASKAGDAAAKVSGKATSPVHAKAGSVRPRARLIRRSYTFDEDSGMEGPKGMKGLGGDGVTQDDTSIVLARRQRAEKAAAAAEERLGRGGKRNRASGGDRDDDGDNFSAIEMRGEERVEARVGRMRKLIGKMRLKGRRAAE